MRLHTTTCNTKKSPNHEIHYDDKYLFVIRFHIRTLQFNDFLNKIFIVQVIY